MGGGWGKRRKGGESGGGPHFLPRGAPAKWGKSILHGLELSADRDTGLLRYRFAANDCGKRVKRRLDWPRYRFSEAFWGPPPTQVHLSSGSHTCEARLILSWLHSTRPVLLTFRGYQRAPRRAPARQEKAPRSEHHRRCPTPPRITGNSLPQQFCDRSKSADLRKGKAGHREHHA